MNQTAIKNVLISVSDKRGLAAFARRLSELGITIYSTGGTRRHLVGEGLEALDVAAYTGFPEMMDGRVKTLHPKVHGGILYRRDNQADLAATAEHGIESFDLVVVNLYPFAATIARPGVSQAEAIEQIDIGGPSMVRSAAKNHAFVAVATSPDQYAEILADVEAHGDTSLELRRRLAAAAFAHTAEYDRAIADYFATITAASADSKTPAPSPSPEVGGGGFGVVFRFPAVLATSYERRAELRYGENPHQPAAVYAAPTVPGASLLSAEQLSGKQLSYNNLLDLDAALAMVRLLAPPAVVVLKHNNPCGAATGGSVSDATHRALAGDPVSAFGSILGFNMPLDVATAEVLAEPGLFVEAIVAPDFEAEALEILTTRPKWKSNVRLLKTGPIAPVAPYPEVRPIYGGLLVQAADSAADDSSTWQVATDAAPSEAVMDELRFAWTTVRFVKSNAIVVSRDKALAGVGAGQMSRVDSVNIAIEKAGERVRGSVLASDAFFPFPDSIQLAAKAGIAAIIQPGGSRKDDEVIAAANEHGIAMVLTGTRHFRH
jgi:phosphoribosylaminoimidazolecarboxamide formyltransferase/IMP cyclohydrolase